MADLVNIGFSVGTQTLIRARDNFKQLNQEAVKLDSTAKRLDQNFNSVSARAGGLRNSIGRLSSGFNTYRHGVQNAAFQTQDLVVQMSSGTAASRALALQLPQLLGGFGALGAIFGTVAALGFSLVPMFMNMGDEAEVSLGKAADATKVLRDAQKDLTDQIINSVAEVQALEEGYDSLTEKVVEQTRATLNNALAEIEADKQREISRVRGGNRAEQIANITARYQEQTEAIELQIRALDRLEAKRALNEGRFATSEGAKRFLQSGATRDPAEIDAIVNIREIRPGKGSSSFLQDAFGFDALLDDLSKGPLAPGEENPLAQAGKSASKDLERAAQKLQDAMGWRPGSSSFLQDAFGPDALFAELEQGPLTSGEQNPLVQRTKTTVDEVSQLYDRAGDRISSAFTGAFTDIIDGTKSVGDAFQDFGRTAVNAISNLILELVILRPLLEGLSNDLGFESSNGGGGLFGAIGEGIVSIFTGNAKGNVYPQNPSGISAYSGTVVDKPTVFPFAKGIGLMGEAGAEGIFPLKRGSDGKMGVSAEGMSPQIEVNVINQNGSEVNVQSNGKGIDVIISDVVARDIAKGGKVFSSISKTFGVSQQLSRRG